MRFSKLALSLCLCACVPNDPARIDAEPAKTREPAPPAAATAAKEPSLGMPTGHVVVGAGRKLPVVVHGTKLARLRLVPLRVGEVDAASKVVGWHPPGKDALASVPRALRAKAIAHPLKETDGTPDEIDVFSIAKSELVLAVLEAPGATPRVAVLQQGELGLLLKVGGGPGLAWVTDTRSGKPVAGARVSLRQGKSVRHRAVTDKDGIARLPAEKQLRIPYVAGHKNADFDAPLVAVAESGKHVALSSERWATGIEPWQFSLPEAYWTGQDAIRGSVTAERGIYRPGEKVHLLGVVRKRLGSGKLAPPGGTVALSVRDPDGNSVVSEKVALTAFGTFRKSIDIPKTARLGGWSVSVDKDGKTLAHRFEVGEYRPVRFEVTLPPADTGGDKALELPLTARYLYGAPVAGGALSYTISAREKNRFGSWADGFSFGSSGSSELVHVTDGKATLDANGVAKVKLDPSTLADAGSSESQAIDLVVEATVTDPAGDSVSASSVHAHARSGAVVGIRSDSWVVSPKQGWPVKIAVAKPDGAPLAGKKIAVRLIRRAWVAVATEHSGGARYHGDWQEETVHTQTLTSATSAASITLPIAKGGEYRLEAGLEGASAFASETVWAYGSDAYGGWENHARMELRADKEGYRPGDRAKLWAEVPWPKAQALVTVEREGVLEARVQKLDGAGTPIELSITGAQAPNVFASVAVVPIGLAGGSPAAGPPLRMGYRELTVSPEARRLRVAVRPASKSARPGDTSEVEVRVTDAKGKPARAEVTLWAADEGVLKLTGYATPDPFVPAYARVSHQVRSSGNLLRWVTDVSDQWDEYGGDEAPADEAGAAFRSRFLGTAFFSKGVVTDARGRATVKVPLPDNLTRWRVMAAAADSGERFGSGEAGIETSKPLQVEPVLPRFLTRGDELDAAVMVQNYTGKRGTVEVRLDVAGAELAGAAKQTVELESGAQAPVRFTLRAKQIGKARVRASATLAGERDGFSIDLPVHAPTLWQTEIVGDGKLDAAKKLDVALPASAEPGLAELVVTVAPGVLASLGGAVDSLMEYPHGCVEQTTSRLIPMVLLEDLLESSGDTRLSGREHRSKMEGAIAHVLRHQNADGGFGLWPSSDSEGFLTAYALWGLLTARDHGYAVPGGTLARGFRYLEQNATQGDDMHGQFSPAETAPFSAFVLASGKRDDAGLGGKLAAKSGALSRFGTGLLGAAFAERNDARADTLLSALGSAKKKGATGEVLIDEPSAGADTFEYGSDLRATAAAVRALVARGKGKDAEDLIAGILAERRKDGSWGTTYNNLWALHALVDFGRHGQPDKTTGRVALELGGKKFSTLDVGPKQRLQTRVVPAAKLPAPGARTSVELTPPKGTSLRYSARLRWAAATAAQKPIDKGFSVKRELLDAKTGKVVTTPTVGQLLRVRVSVTTPVARSQVALIDRIPAGFEPVDTALLTSASDPQGSAGVSDDWVWRELHDERVTHFADSLPAGTHRAEYLVRATRAGTFVRPAPSAEAMYAPDVFGHGAIESVVVKR